MVSTVNKSKTDESVKDLWGTGVDLVNDARKIYGRDFKTDVATLPHNAKANNYILPPDFLDIFLSVKGWQAKERFKEAQLIGKTCIGFDALLPAMDWGNDWFCNPPFSDRLRKAFITKAKEQQQEGNSGVMILPYVPATGWFDEYLSTGVIVYEPNGRYNYVDQNGVEQKGCNFDSCVVVFPSFFVKDSIRIRYQRYFWRGIEAHERH